jgi:toxin ParE1/3/4
VDRRVIFSPEAALDVSNLYDYIAKRSGSARAIGYVSRIEAYCREFRLFAERGTKRDEVRPGLRTVGFERRITIAFHVEPEFVVIDRILYGGRDLKRAFRKRRRRGE